MIPELSSVYGLSPSEVWDMPLSQYRQYLEHHRQLAKSLSDG